MSRISCRLQTKGLVRTNIPLLRSMSAKILEFKDSNFVEKRTPQFSASVGVFSYSNEFECYKRTIAQSGWRGWSDIYVEMPAPTLLVPTLT